MDNLTALQRQATMRAVRSKDTSPEMFVRRLIHALGYRYRLHDQRLPGCPDMVFPVRKKLIFIHGCFWHGHRCPAGLNRPASNKAYWRAKLMRNRLRDARHVRDLRKLGWKILTIWECEIRSPGLRRRLIHFLEKR